MSPRLSQSFLFGPGRFVPYERLRGERNNVDTIVQSFLFGPGRFVPHERLRGERINVDTIVPIVLV